MNLKQFFVLFCLFLFFSSASALVFASNKTAFFKGERIVIIGNAVKSLRIVAVQERKNLVFNQSVQLDWNGDFRFEYNIGFSDPKGNWTITLTDSESKEELPVSVSPVRESEFLVVAFLSPAPSSFKRLESFELTVKLTDAGRPVNEAMLNYWGIDGEKLQLKNIGDGIYSNRIELPIDAPLGEWNLTVTAYNGLSRDKRGGENSIKLNIFQAGIVFDILEPRVSEYIIGKPILLRAFVHYDSNAPVESVERATLMFGNEKIDFNRLGSGFFSAEVDPLKNSKEAKPVELFLEVHDSVGNSASKTISFRPIGELFWFIKSNAIFYIIPALFILYVAFLSVREFSSYLAILRLRRKKAMLFELKKRLQKDYFIENMISRQDYETQEQEYDVELNNIETKLKSLEQKKELL